MKFTFAGSEYEGRAGETLAAALVRNGVNVRLLTSPFRFGEVPQADGFTVDDSLYRVSAGLSSGRARLVVKALR